MACARCGAAGHAWLLTYRDIPINSTRQLLLRLTRRQSLIQSRQPMCIGAKRRPCRGSLALLHAYMTTCGGFVNEIQVLSCACFTNRIPPENDVTPCMLLLGRKREDLGGRTLAGTKWRFLLQLCLSSVTAHGFKPLEKP